MKIFRVSSGQTGNFYGNYFADTKQEALDLAAQKYGYESWQDGLDRRSALCENFVVQEVDA